MPNRVVKGVLSAVLLITLLTALPASAAARVRLGSVARTFRARNKTSETWCSSAR